ncbi:right-handed parallel beta-helix repeat-containing protein [Opitutus sp. ER46]|uniref:right-handed parallel beta-helix repeat-containing protein n=1 Tax=Opitutus sp. ER46 TaxID=2161864 RepID=UPI000D311779|nr:right-handed parallel beta-helix repeat-containing protein [Opitutus sp. ER46]PTX94620.1 hypothetical protein DB354_12890 [Opitutus sp. ER46]
MRLPLAALFCALTLPLGAAEEPALDLHLAPGELQAVPSFDACSYYFRPSGTPERPFAVEFRRAGELTWRRGFAPVSDTPAGVWKGSLFDLAENTAWELHVLNASGAEIIPPVSFRTWTSHPPTARVLDLSTLPGAAQGLVITDQGRPDGWIKYTAPKGWRLERPDTPGDGQRGAITLRNARYVILENLTIVGGARHGIHLEQCDSIRILNCDISGWGRVGTQQFTNDGARGKYADANGELINYDAGVKIDASARTVVERCYVHDPRGRSNSWQYSHPAGPTAVHVNNTHGGNVIRWNDFIGSDEHRWNDVIESSSNGSALGGFFRDSDISGNFLVYGNDDGVELEGGGMNVRFYSNKIEGTTCGISTGACLLGPQFIYGNLVVHEGDEAGLALMLFKNSHGVPQSGKRHFINNTVFTAASAPYGNYGKPIGSERIGYLRNNVFVASSARRPDEKMRRDDFDGDLFWTDGNAASSAAYLAGLRQIGQEEHGLAADPRLAAPHQGDFHLAPGSPAKGRGRPVANLAVAGGNLGAFADATTEVPYRPLALTATPRQLEFGRSDQPAVQDVRVAVPASAREPVAFEIRQNSVFNWFKVSPAMGLVKPGEEVILQVTIDPARLKGRPQFRGAFLVRTPSGLSRPVSVYAQAEFSEDLRPADAPNTAYIEAAAVPALASHVQSSSRPGQYGGKYARLAQDEAPEIRATFKVPRDGRYALLVRAGIQRGAMHRREFAARIDQGETVHMEMNPDYNWNTDNDRFRAVYVCAVGHLNAGAHELSFKVNGGLNLNEIIVTDTPAAFMADGWQRKRP